MKYAWLAALAILLGRMNGAARAESSPGDSLTAESAVALTLKSHPQIEEARRLIEASRARIELGRSAYYPQVSGHVVYTRLDPVVEVDIPGDGSFSTMPTNKWNFFLGLDQVAYDFGRRRTDVDLARSGVACAQERAELVRSGLAYATIRVFYGALHLRRALSVTEEQISVLHQLLDINKEKLRTGSATEFDTLTTQVRIAAALTRKIETEEELAESMILLRRLTGLPDGEELSLKGSFSSASAVPESDSLLTAALRLRPEMRLAREAETAAELHRQLASLGRRPTVNLDLRLGFQNGYLPDLNKQTANYAVGASVGAPIFTGFRTRSQEAEALAELRAAQARSRDLEQRIEAEVRQALAKLRAASEKIDLAEVQVRQAARALEMAKVRYSAGTATNLDLLDAQTALSEARLARTSAAYSHLISLYSLDQATGKVIW